MQFHHIFLLPVNRSVAELGSGGVVDGIRDNLLDLLRETLLQSLGDLGVAGSVRDLAGLVVGTGVVEGVRDLLLGALGDLVDVLLGAVKVS